MQKFKNMTISHKLSLLFNDPNLFEEQETDSHRD